MNEKVEPGLFIDLSHTIEHGLVTYKGLPAPIVCDYLSRENSRQFYEEGTEFQIGRINSLGYVLKMTKHKERFNLLAVVKEPKEDCKGIRIDGFDFVGYELLDKFYSSSALTNLGCMDKGFLSHELNHLGLLDSLDKAHHIQEHLRKNYPDMEDADTKIIAVWRHRRIGRWRRPRRHV